MIGRLRWTTAALLAFIMGVPMAEQASAAGTGNVVTAAFSLAQAIIDLVGDS